MNIDLSHFKNLVRYADRAAFYLRDLERGDTFSPGEHSEIRSLALNVQVTADEATAVLIGQERITAVVSGDWSNVSDADVATASGSVSSRARRAMAMNRKRDLAERTDRDGTVYATADELRAAHRAQRAKLMAAPADPYHRLAVAKARMAELELERMQPKPVETTSIETPDDSIELGSPSVTITIVDRDGKTEVHSPCACAADVLLQLKKAGIRLQQVAHERFRLNRVGLDQDRTCRPRAARNPWREAQLLDHRDLEAGEGSLVR